MGLFCLIFDHDWQDDPKNKNTMRCRRCHKTINTRNIPDKKFDEHFGTYKK